MSFKKKLFFYFLTLVLILSAAEVILRFTGILYLSQRKNIFNIDTTKGEFRILCLGESTTAFGLENSYPSLLQERLNELSQTHFKVVNAGVPAQTTSRMIENLPNLMRSFKPHLVIIMAGINDHHIPGQRRLLFYEKLKLYKLAHMAALRFKILVEEKPKSILNQDWEKPSLSFLEYFPLLQKQLKDPNLSISFLIEDLLQSHRALNGSDYQRIIASIMEAKPHHIAQSKELLEKLKKLYLKSIEADPENSTFYIAYMGYLRNEYMSIAKPEVVDQEILDIGAKTLKLTTEEAEPYHYLALTYFNLKDHKKAHSHFEKSVVLKPHDFHFWFSYIHFLVNTNKLQEALIVAKRAVEKIPFNYRLIETVRRLEKGVGDKNYIVNLSVEPEDAHPNPNPYIIPQTVKNLNHIIQFIHSQHALVAMMQYPTRRIEQMEEIVAAYNPDTLLTIENRENFIKEIEKHGYDSIFWDRFAGDFGHATKQGQSLIVDNVVSNLENKLCPKIKELCFNIQKNSSK